MALNNETFKIAFGTLVWLLFSVMLVLLQQ